MSCRRRSTPRSHKRRSPELAFKDNDALSQGPVADPARPSLVVYWILAAIALIGLADATYLTIAHLVGDDAVCGSAVGCSTVLGSAYATIRGIPTAAFGAIAYFTVFSLAILAAFGYARMRSLLAVLVGLMFVASLYFLYLQAFVLHAFCPFCLLSAALTFILAGLLVAFPAAR
jgi:uncharacterized membrane protein